MQKKQLVKIYIESNVMAFRCDIMTRYLQDFHNLYERFAKEIRRLSPLLGDKIPIELPAINALYDALDDFVISNSKTRELKFYEDKNSHQEREIYLESLQKLIGALNGIQDQYKQYFKVLVDTSNQMLDLINRTTSIVETSIDVLPSKNQALCDYCTLVSKLKHC